MFRPFGEKHISEIQPQDLQALITEEVPEGLFVEYKSEWASHKVARAVASFANSPGGGWLIVGIEAAGLLPKAIAPLDDNGDLEERVVQTVRSSVTPVPPFAPRAVETEPGKAGLVVHVPEGTQPPYILVRTGQVLVRTATSSEPVGINDREALDRLFARGERGSIWARKFADGLRASARDDWSAVVWTVPAVDDGLAAIPAIFYRSFAQAVLDQLKTFGWVHSAFAEQRARQDMGEDLMTMSIPTVEGDDSLLRMSVRGSGVICSIWTRPRQGTDGQALKGLLRWALPSHARLYEERLGHRGLVGVAVSAHWNTPDHQPSLVFVPHVPVRLEELSGEALHDSLDRSIDRSQGYLTPEPEF
jgi:Schlafen, AlbA_2